MEDEIVILVFGEETPECSCHDCTLCAQRLFDDIELAIAIEQEIREGRFYVMRDIFEV